MGTNTTERSCAPAWATGLVGVGLCGAVAGTFGLVLLPTGFQYGSQAVLAVVVGLFAVSIGFSETLKCRRVLLHAPTHQRRYVADLSPTTSQRVHVPAWQSSPLPLTERC
jgi:hypothetical protein